MAELIHDSLSAPAGDKAFARPCHKTGYAALLLHLFMRVVSHWELAQLILQHFQQTIGGRMDCRMLQTVLDVRKVARVLWCFQNFSV